MILVPDVSQAEPSEGSQLRSASKARQLPVGLQPPAGKISWSKRLEAPIANRSGSKLSSSGALNEELKKQLKEQISEELREPLLLQRRAARFLRRRDPKNIEENMDMLFGVPKVVWVLLADAVAMAVWIGCIMAALNVIREPAEK